MDGNRTGWYVAKESVPSVLDAAQSAVHRLWCMIHMPAMLSCQQLHPQAHPEDRNIICGFKKSWAEACMCDVCS